MANNLIAITFFNIAITIYFAIIVFFPNVFF